MTKIPVNLRNLFCSSFISCLMLYKRFYASLYKIRRNQTINKIYLTNKVGIVDRVQNHNKLLLQIRKKLELVEVDTVTYLEGKIISKLQCINEPFKEII